VTEEEKEKRRKELVFPDWRGRSGKHDQRPLKKGKTRAGVS
jgi:hypothetical protein